MAIGTKGLAPVDLDAMDDETLVAELKKVKEELFNLRFQSATGQLESHGRLKAVRRDIPPRDSIPLPRELRSRTAPTAERDRQETATPQRPRPRRPRSARTARRAAATS